jgi:pimeloyl-ACP methyl ester carboxylesterase
MDRKLGRGGEPLLFVHANGYTAGAYRQLLEPLQERYQVHARELRPLKRGSRPTRDWYELVHELNQYADQTFPKPVIGVGHSLGAVSLLLSAAQDPERYSQLVLIEPVAIPTWASLLLRFAPAAVRARGPLARGARQRHDTWSSAEEAFACERRRRSLARISDSVLQDILDDGLVTKPEGQVTLRYTKEWEALLYESPASVWPVLRDPLLKLPPVTVVRGGESRVLSSKDVRQWQAARPEHEVVELAEAGHLAPLERPIQVAVVTLAALARHRPVTSSARPTSLSVAQAA